MSLGYIHDEETQLYYCQSRYYNPEVGRFINADAFAATGQGLLGNNMFAYCRNNPVCRVDASGTADTIAHNDGELLSNDELDGRNGGGSSTIYNESFKSYQVNSANLNAESSINPPAGKGFQNFTQLKSYLGPAGEGYHWHHIVEQCQIARSGFAPEQIHNTTNIIQVQAATHAQITGHYNTTTLPYTNGLSVRNWLAGQPFAVQYEYGIDVLRQFGVMH